MIRSIYETLTNSCIPKINEDVVISKRTAEQFKAGILKWEKGRRWKGKKYLPGMQPVWPYHKGWVFQRRESPLRGFAP